MSVNNDGSVSFYRGTSGAQGMYWENQGRLVINTTNSLHELVFAGGDPADILYTGTNYLSIAASNNVAIRFYVAGSHRAEFNDNGLKMMAGHGIEFSVSTAHTKIAGTSGSEILDDYEEGTWTPALAGGGGTCTHSQQTGWYTKVGELVTVGGTIIVSANGSYANSTTKILGLPYGVKNVGGARAAGALGALSNFAEGASNPGEYATLVADPGATYIWIIRQNNDGTYHHAHSVADNAAIYGFTISYRAA